jgi:hypothetical protein
VIIALIGAVIGYVVFRGTSSRGRTVVAVALLVSVGVLAALLPMSGQLFYDIGFPWLANETAEHVSFAVVGFCFGAAWRVVTPSQWRWALLSMLALSLSQPAVAAFTYYIWDTRGFGP